MDLSSELRKIQQEKHKKQQQNNELSEKEEKTNELHDSSNKLSPPKMDSKQPSIPSSTDLDTNQMDIDNNSELKDNDNDINDENDTKIDWDKEIAAQLQQQYNHIDDELESSSNTNNDNDNDAPINISQQQQQQSSSMLNHFFGNNDNVDFFSNIIGSNSNNANPMFRQFMSNNNNNDGNNSNNGHYSFSFSTMGPNGFSMSYSSNNNNNINDNNNGNIHRNNEIPPQIADMLNQMNHGMFMGQNSPLNSLFGSRNINNMSYEELLEHFPIINRGLNENEINNNSIVDNYKTINKNIKKENKNIKNDKLKEIKKSENENCSICLESFKENDKIRRLPCLHIFHQNEIDQWLKTKDACPICRQSIKQNNN